MARYVNLIQTHVRCKIELISILRINCCIRSAFAYYEPSLKEAVEASDVFVKIDKNKMVHLKKAQLLLPSTRCHVLY